MPIMLLVCCVIWYTACAFDSPLSGISETTSVFAGIEKMKPPIPCAMSAKMMTNGSISTSTCGKIG